MEFATRGAGAGAFSRLIDEATWSSAPDAADLSKAPNDAHTTEVDALRARIFELEQREGERCEWDPVGVPPPSPPLWARLGGALPAGTAAGPLLTCALVGGKTALLALALRRLLPTPVPVAS